MASLIFFHPHAFSAPSQYRCIPMPLAHFSRQIRTLYLLLQSKFSVPPPSPATAGRQIYPLRGMLRIVSGFPRACLYFRTHLHLDCLRLQPQVSVKWRMVRASVHFAAAKQFADSIEAQSPSIKFPWEWSPVLELHQNLLWPGDREARTRLALPKKKEVRPILRPPRSRAKEEENLLFYT